MQLKLSLIAVALSLLLPTSLPATHCRSTGSSGCDIRLFHRLCVKSVALSVVSFTFSFSY